MNIKETLNYFATNLYNKTKNSFVEKEDNKGLSSNDYTDEDKNKLGGLPSDTYTKSEINNALSSKSDTSHTHDDRYYTETEIDTKLSTKSDSTHNHDSSYYTKSDVYTKTETDNKLSTKSDSTHTHDDRYYTETEIDTKLSGKSDTSHNHDSSYYTKSEINSKLSNLPTNAKSTTYDNTDSGLTSTNVQGAIDELKILATSGSTSGVIPLNVVNPSLSTGNGSITVLWGDPEDTTIDGTVMAEWQGTKLVYKVGSYPTNVNDGTLAVDNQIKDQYKTTGFTINNLTNGETYYFALFPYSTDGAINTNEENRLSGSPQAYRVMTAIIDKTNSNPSTCITYDGDASTMTAGSSDWDSFFGHYPCLFKDGAEVGKLNPNNFAQFEDGSSADITSGSAGDVMIAFPKMGYKITTIGNTILVGMTDNPNAEGYCYLAHTRGTTVKDKFYLGAYKGYVSSSKLRSLSGKTPTVNTTIGNFRTYAQANGSGYDQSAFYQLVYRQCMYLLKYKNLDSQTAVGQGYVNGSSAVSTGGTNKKRMDYGTTSQTQQMKLFGLEDFWGNVHEFIDGIFSDSSYNILTATENFNDTGSGYTNRGSSGFSSNTGNWISDVQGTSETGFIIKGTSGSSSTYYCDSGSLYASRLACFGGSWGDGASTGAFSFGVRRSASSSSASVSARLMYL